MDDARLKFSGGGRGNHLDLVSPEPGLADGFPSGAFERKESAVLGRYGLVEAFESLVERASCGATAVRGVAHVAGEPRGFPADLDRDAELAVPVGPLLNLDDDSTSDHDLALGQDAASNLALDLSSPGLVFLLSEVGLHRGDDALVVPSRRKRMSAEE